MFFSNKGTIIKKAGVWTPWTPPESAPAISYHRCHNVSVNTVQYFEHYQGCSLGLDTQFPNVSVSWKLGNWKGLGLDVVSD